MRSPLARLPPPVDLLLLDFSPPCQAQHVKHSAQSQQSNVQKRAFLYALVELPGTGKLEDIHPSS